MRCANRNRNNPDNRNNNVGFRCVRQGKLPESGPRERPERVPFSLTALSPVPRVRAEW